MYISLTLLIFLISLNLQGQALAEDVLLKQLTSGPSRYNEVRIQQQGLSNQASVQQTNAQQSQINIEQQGNAHQLNAHQQGDNNNWDIQQSGKLHQFDGSLSGNNNRVQVRQLGSQNSIQQDLIGNGMDYSIIQDGQQLELIQIEHNSLAPAYEIQQRGSDMTIIIKQGFSINP
ncbi:MAG: hypothetical protein AAF992_08590 [Bacteroidota bacterium]